MSGVEKIIRNEDSKNITYDFPIYKSYSREDIIETFTGDKYIITDVFTFLDDEETLVYVDKIGEFNNEII